MSHQYIYNDNGEVAGQIISLGVYFKSFYEMNTSNITICVFKPDFRFHDWSLRSPIHSWGVTFERLAGESILTTEYALISNVSLTETQACFAAPVYNSTMSYYVVGLIENWSTVTAQTWSTTELSLMVFLREFFGHSPSLGPVISRVAIVQWRHEEKCQT
eukprot:TRINITY_DN16825_c0_g1_i1.p1 TRINITY_DN16825_c0_g1~~TRINITY_DN16825_c0_g1_i1.p1  ORF type:complete len:184 (+),score=2.14 TRINITY_DN16825_c0_g1_i1:75-554(+)